MENIEMMYYLGFWYEVILFFVVLNLNWILVVRLEIFFVEMI